VQPMLQWKSDEYYTACVCALVPIGIQHAMRMRHVICGLARSTIFFPHYLINGTIFDKTLWKTKCVFRVSLHICLQHFSF